jgi:hypothetical protein
VPSIPKDIMLKYALVYSIALAVASIGVTPVATFSAYAQSQVPIILSDGSTGWWPKGPAKKSIKRPSNLHHSTKGGRMGGGGGAKAAPPVGQPTDFPGRR